MPTPFFAACVHWPDRYAAALTYLVHNYTEITREQFMSRVDDDAEVPPESERYADYAHVDGFPDIVFYRFSGIEYVFARESDIRKLQAHAERADEAKKERQGLFWKDAGPAVRNRRYLKNKDGTPLDLYHGSNVTNIKRFAPTAGKRMGIFGSTRDVVSPVVCLTPKKDVAAAFAKNRAEFFDDGKWNSKRQQTRVYKVRPRVDKVLDVRKMSVAAIFKKMQSIGVDMFDYFGCYDAAQLRHEKKAANLYFDKAQFWELLDEPDVVAKLDKAGYDMVIFHEGGHDKQFRTDTYAVLRPEFADIVERINGLLCERANDAARVAAALKMRDRLVQFLSRMLGIAEAEGARIDRRYGDSLRENIYIASHDLYAAMTRHGIVFPALSNLPLPGDLHRFELIVSAGRVAPVSNKDERRRKLTPISFGFRSTLPVGGYASDERPTRFFVALPLNVNLAKYELDTSCRYATEVLRAAISQIGGYGGSSTFVHEYTHYLDAHYMSPEVSTAVGGASARAGWSMDGSNGDVEAERRNTYFAGDKEVNARVSELYGRVMRELQRAAANTARAEYEDGVFVGSGEQYAASISDMTPFKDDTNKVHLIALLILNRVRHMYPVYNPKSFARQYVHVVVPSDVLDRPENADLRRKVYKRLAQLCDEAISWVRKHAQRIVKDGAYKDTGNRFGYEGGIDYAARNQAGYIQRKKNKALGESGGEYMDDGHVRDASGRTFWGKSASGILWCRVHPTEGPQVMLALRSAYVDEPNTWAIPGGAVPRGMSPWDSARKETDEELGGLPSEFEVVGKNVWRVPGGTFTYHTFVVLTRDHEWTPKIAGNWETAEFRWMSPDKVRSMNLHPGFEESWPKLGRYIARAFARGAVTEGSFEAPNGMTNNPQMVTVLDNPTHEQVAAMCRRSECKSLRGILTTDGDVYIWDALDSTHTMIELPPHKPLIYLNVTLRNGQLEWNESDTGLPDFNPAVLSRARVRKFMDRIEGMRNWQRLGLVMSRFCELHSYLQPEES